MTGILLWSLLISLILNLIFFIVAYKLRTDKFTDITYSLSFVIIVLFAYNHADNHSFEVIGTFLVLIWAIRLGGFLLHRVIKNGRDRRFDGMRESFTSFAKFWLGQAIVAWVLMIPSISAFSGNKKFSLFSIIGILIWLVGLMIETTADLQKFNFRSNPQNKDKWIDTGIWRYSRHPNYFGEILIWLGIYLYALPALDPIYKLVGLISPILIFVLLRYGSGIPILERSADKKWGSDSRYIEYKAKTRLLLPLK